MLRKLLLMQMMRDWRSSVLLISLLPLLPQEIFFLLDIARQRNQTPLPLIKPYSGPRLPPDSYCLTAPNYRPKSLPKKVSTSAGRMIVPQLSVGSVTSRPSTPTLSTPTPQAMSISTKVGTSVSLTGQRFTVTDAHFIIPSCKSINSCNISSSECSN